MYFVRLLSGINSVWKSSNKRRKFIFARSHIILWCPHRVFCHSQESNRKLNARFSHQFSVEFHMWDQKKVTALLLAKFVLFGNCSSVVRLLATVVTSMYCKSRANPSGENECKIFQDPSVVCCYFTNFKIIFLIIILLCGNVHSFRCFGKLLLTQKISTLDVYRLSVEWNYCCFSMETYLYVEADLI